MEKTFSIFEAKTHFSSLIRQVKAGTRAKITDRGKPVAIISRIEEGEDSYTDWISSLLENNSIQKASGDGISLINYNAKKAVPGALNRFLEDRD